MKDLIEIQKKDGLFVVSSRQVARDFEKNHKHVLDSIDLLVTGVAEKSAGLFIPSEYIHEQNKQKYREYLLTRDGFSLLVMGFSGVKSLEWKLKYIEAFNKMEEVIATGLEGLSTEMQALIMHDKKIQAVVEHISAHDKKIENLENNMVIDYGQQQVLKKRVNGRVTYWLGGKESNAYKEISKKVFSECNGDIQDYFNVNSRNNVPKIKFDAVIDYVAKWQPCTNTKLLIEDCNVQMSIA